MRCTELPDTGNCRESYTKYYYDPFQRDCIHFNYGGCAGNENRFDTKESCMRVCRGVTGGFLFTSAQGSLTWTHELHTRHMRVHHMNKKNHFFSQSCCKFWRCSSFGWVCILVSCWLHFLTTRVDFYLSMSFYCGDPKKKKEKLGSFGGFESLCSALIVPPLIYLLPSKLYI